MNIILLIHTFTLQNMIGAHPKVNQLKPPEISDIESAFKQANYQQAIAQRDENSNRFYKGQEVKGFVNLSFFKMYGVGIYLFFSFIKHAIFLFLILTIVSIAPIVLNAVKGSTFRHNQNSLSILLTKSSLGSHKYSIMTVENAYSTSIAYKIVNATFDIISCFIFLVFCLYWQRKSRTIQKHISKQIKLQSKLTVEAVQFPKDMREQQMEQFMRRFGSPTEVVAARDYSQQINISKKIFDTKIEIKQLELEDKQYCNTQNAQPLNVQKIQNLNRELYNLYQQLDSIQTRTHKITRFYIQFPTVEERKSVLRKFNQYQKLCSCCKEKPVNMKFGGQDVKIVECNTEPTGILWENAHIKWRNRLPRALLQLFLILFIMFGCFILISFLNILIPPVDSDINTSNLNYEQVRNQNNKTIVQAWCNNNYELTGAQNSPYFSTCQTYWKLYTNSVIISVTISVVIMVICEIKTKVVYALASFQRFTTKAQYSVTIMTNLFVTDFLTTTLITFLMQADIFGLSVMNFLRSIISSPDLVNNINSMSVYSDLIPKWYKDIGYQIWFNIFMMIFLPQLTEPPTYYLLQKLSQCQGKKQKVHKNMVKALQFPQFEVESMYSSILLIISTGMIFGGGLQIMMIVVFACLLVRYFYLKFMFIRFFKVPQVYNQILNERVITILKIILIIRFLISIYMYGADDVFAMEKSTFMLWASSLGVPVFSSIFVILSRFLLTWYYSMFAILFILVLVFKQPIFMAVYKLKQYCKNRNKQIDENIKNNVTENQLLPTAPGQNIGKPNSMNLLKAPEQTMKSEMVGEESILESWISNKDQQVMSQRNAIKSYKLQNNPNYEQILIIMKLRGVQVSSQSQSKNKSHSKGVSIQDI